MKGSGYLVMSLWADLNRDELVQMPSGHLAFCAPDLIPEIRSVLAADHQRRAGTRPPGVHEAAHAAPDMPLGELEPRKATSRNVSRL